MINDCGIIYLVTIINLHGSFFIVATEPSVTM